MGRRAHKSEADKANRRLPSDFFTHFFFPPLDEAVQSYRLVEPFPLADAEIVGRYLDRAFGRLDLCRLSTEKWALSDRVAIAVREYKPERDEPQVGAFVAETPPAAITRIGLDEYRLTFSAVTYYPASMYAHNPRCMMHRRMHEGVGDTDREIAAEIKAWAARVTDRANEASAARVFLREALKAAGSMNVMFRALPGLRGVCSSLGVLSGVLIEAEQPYRGKDFFNSMLMDARMPLWRTAWTEQHRPALLKTIAAAGSDSVKKRYMPSAMSVIRLDKDGVTR